MIVKWNNVLVITSTLSNKQQKKKLKISNVIYSKRVSNIDTVYFLQPKIDGLTVVLPINDQSARAAIVSHLIGLCDEGDKHFTEAKKPYPSGYQKNIDLTDPSSGERILIQAKPKKVGVSFMRFDFNPAKLGKQGISFLRKSLAYGFPGVFDFSDIATIGKVTRMDVACDILNCSISNLLVRIKGGGKSHAFFGIDDEIETIYLGIPKGQKNSGNYAYNKRQDLLDKSLPRQFSGIPYTRIETRIKNLQCPVTSLTKLDKNPFDKFEVFFPTLVKAPEQKHHWTFFIDSCWHRGIEAALEVLPDPMRKKYASALAQSTDGFWQPDKLWAALPSAIMKSGILNFSN